MYDIENEIDFELACNTRHKVLEDVGMSMDWLLGNCSREVNFLAGRMDKLRTDSVMEAAYSLWCEWMDEDGQLADLSASRLMVVATFIRDKKITIPMGGILKMEATGATKVERNQKVVRMIEGAKESLKACTLCGKPRISFGVFFPDNSTQFGAPPGEDRILCYALCASCANIPEKIRHKKIETQLLENVISKPWTGQDGSIGGRHFHPDEELPVRSVNASHLDGTAVKFCMVGNPKGANIPLWKRTSAMAEDKTVFMSASFCGPENIVFIATCNDGIPIILDGDHLFVPTEWVIKSFPNNKDLKDLAEVTRRTTHEHFGVGI
jgi:hypothetical protein